MSSWPLRLSLQSKTPLLEADIGHRKVQIGQPRPRSGRSDKRNTEIFNEHAFHNAASATKSEHTIQ
jgi:hypothetical protein